MCQNYYAMSKTIVNIIDKSNPLPAYLFTKEYYEEGDELLFISTEEEANCIQLLTTRSGGNACEEYHCQAV